jgi:TetR/AcrR family acrAB operon transcriptional repressor
MAKRSKEDAAETREKILTAALEVFSRKGYSRATFVDIAKEIGLSKGAVYWHFKTKPDLLAALIQQAQNRNCSLASNTPPQTLAELRTALGQSIRRVAENKDVQTFEFFRNFQIEWSSELMTEIKTKLKELEGDPMLKFTEMLTHLKELGELKPKTDTHLLACAFASMWIGALHMALTGKCSFEEFHLLLNQNFDLLIDKYATRPMTGTD